MLNLTSAALDPAKFKEGDTHETKFAYEFTSLKQACKPRISTRHICQHYQNFDLNNPKYLDLNFPDKLKLFQINVLHDNSVLK